MVIFEKNPGVVVRLRGPVTQALLSVVNVLDSPIIFEQRRSIITAIGLQEGVNFQVAHAIGNDLFFYTFGDVPGDLELGGLSFSGTCDGGNQHGVELMRDWYHRMKLSRRPRPIRISIGRMIIVAILVKGFFQLNDPETGVGRWTLRLLTAPPDV